MELACRVMYNMQQDYFQYLSKIAAGLPAVCPTYDAVVERVQTHRAQSLSALPSHWYLLVGCPNPKTSGVVVPSPATAPAAMRVNAPSVNLTNPRADPVLLSRYKACGHSMITALLGG